MRHKPRGKFIPREPMIFVHPYAGYKPGQTVPRSSYSRLRRWWRMGMICQVAALSKKELKALDVKSPEKPAEETPAEDPQLETDVEDGEASDPTPVTSEEGEKGWYKVLFSDGSEVNMRRSAVEKLGLLKSGEE